MHRTRRWPPTARGEMLRSPALRTMTTASSCDRAGDAQLLSGGQAWSCPAGSPGFSASTRAGTVPRKAPQDAYGPHCCVPCPSGSKVAPLSRVSLSPLFRLPKSSGAVGGSSRPLGIPGNRLTQGPLSGWISSLVPLPWREETCGALPPVRGEAGRLSPSANNLRAVLQTARHGPP